MNELTQTSFDYAALPIEAAMSGRIVGERLRTRLKRTVQDIIESGKDLIQIKPTLAGHFESWFEFETGLDRHMAYKFILAAERFGDGMVNNLPSISPTVIYLLSAPSTPESVVAQAIEKAESGEKVTIAEVKEWKERAEEFRQESNDRRKKIRDLEHQVDLLKAEQPEAKVIEKVIEKEVIPPDYQQTKETLATLQAEHAKQAEALKQLRKNQKKEVDEQVNRKLREHDREYNDKERAIQDAERYLESLQQKIDRYSSQQKDLETILSALERMRIELATFAAMLETCGPMVAPDAEAKPTRAIIGHMEVILTGLYARLGEHSQLLPALAVD